LTTTVENTRVGVAASASTNVTTTVDYDSRGLQTQVTDPRGNTTGYVRDALGRLTGETDALGQTTTTVFDGAGQRTSVTAGDGSVTSFEYTLDGFASKVAYPGKDVVSTFDALGRRVSMRDPVGVSAWVYDWVGRVLSESDALGKTTGHTFDLVGNAVGTTYPDGRVIDREFDGRGLATKQADSSGATSLGYDATGALVGEVRASGVSTSLTRDLLGRVTSIVHSGRGVVSSSLPSGEVNPSSAAPGNAFGHCKDNGGGHPNQAPAGCSMDTLAFTYAYDARGLITQRDVTTVTAQDATTTETTYAHDALGRLTRSATGAVVTTYGWDAGSNLVSEAGTDDPTTTKTGDAYAITRSVDAANELVTLVKNPTGTPGGKVATTQFSYDRRGNRTGGVTTTQTGNKTHVESTSTFVYDSMDQLTSTSGLEGSASWIRDGVGRALTVTEDGVTSTRLFDGFTVVAQGATQLTTGPDGSVLGQTTTTTTTKGKTTTTSVTSVDVLTDVLGSAVATASGGVISADLALFGDFGDALTTPKTDTVTGFTGHVETAGLVEFASRAYDPTSRVWVQDDRYRGTTTRASSMNRYAYVEGAPESFVDVLGFFRAAAAIQAQKLAALEAAYQSAVLAAYRAAPACSGFGCFANWQVQQAGNAMYAQTYGPRAPGTIAGNLASAIGSPKAAVQEVSADSRPVDWGTGVAGILNIGYGLYKIQDGVKNIAAGGYLEISIVGLPAGVVATDYGVFELAVGAFRTVRGVRQVIRGFFTDKCQQNCDTGSNLARLGVGVVPGGSLAERSSWYRDKSGSKPGRRPDWLDHLGSFLF
jgi:RHS repeat-associated protein